VIEPGAGEGPVTAGGGLGDSQDLRRLRDGESDKVPQLDQLSGHFVFDGKFIQRLVDGEELLLIRSCGDLDFLNVHALQAAAMAQSAFAAGIIDENAPHRFRRGCEEMGAAFKLWIVGTD